MEFFDIVKLVFFIVVSISIGVFLKVHLGYRKNVYKIVSDIMIVYRNFFHWNLSKIILNAYSWLFGLIVSAPLLALEILLLFKTSEVLGSENIKLLSLVVASGDIGAMMKTFSNFGTKGIWFLLSFIGVIIIMAIVLFAFMYSYFLLQNIYRNYMIGKKLAISKWSSVSALTFAFVSLILGILFSENPYIFIGSVLGAGILASPFFIFGILKSENEFLNYKLIWKFLGVSSWTGLYLIFPSLLLVAILYIPQYGPITAMIEDKNLIVLSLYILLFGVAFTYFIYVCIRLIFTNLTLLADIGNYSRPAKDYVLESLAITKGKALHIASVSLPFLIISLILTELIKYLDNLNQIVPVFTGIFDFLIVSGIGFMVLNSLFGIFNAKTYTPAKLETIVDDNGLAQIKSTEAKNEVKPIISSTAPANSNKSPIKKAPAKKKAPVNKTK